MASGIQSLLFGINLGYGKRNATNTLDRGGDVWAAGIVPVLAVFVIG